MVLPTAIIAGVNKAGTTALFHALAAQDDVAVSNVKETQFFTPLRFGDPVPDLAEYARLFPSQTQARTVVEATPEYFYGAERIARAIDGALPGVRIAVVLREPGARAYSWWRFSRSRLWIPSDIDFRSYLERCRELGDEPEADRSLGGWRALTGGLYARYLPAWQETFGDRLQVLFYDDVRADFEGSMRRLCAHFGTEWRPGDRAPQEHNVTTDVSSAGLQRLALSVNRAGERLWRRAPRLKATLRSAYYRVNARSVQEGMREEDRAWLDAYFEDDLARLEVLTRSLADRPGWVTRGDRAAADQQPA